MGNNLQMKLKNQTFIPNQKLIKTVLLYAGLFLIALLVELFVFNLNSFRTIGKTPVDLTQQFAVSGEAVYHPETDKYTVTGEEFTLYAQGLDVDITNLYLGLNFENQIIPYDIYLTDEGHSSVYQMAQQRILSGLADSRYMTIHPYGKVHSLKIVFHVTDGSAFELRQISMNTPRPFHIRFPRLGVIFIILALFAMVRKESLLHSIVFAAKSKKQLLFGMLCLVMALNITYKLNQGNIEIWREGYVISEYSDLTNALSEGHFDLGYPVSEELLAMENPYDYEARASLQVPYSYDTAFYNGKYYCYFGITPVLLLYLPSYLLTGSAMQNWQVSLIFAMLLVAGSFFLVRELMCRWFPKAPLFLWPMLSVIIAFSGNYVFLYQKPDFYNIPIVTASALTVCGLALWLRGIRASSVTGKVALYAMGSLSLALVAGARPQVALFSLLAVPLFWEEVIGKRELFSKKSIGRTIAIVLPYVIVAAFLMYYNYKRFGSPFDFGANYNMTTNDMTKRGFNLDRLGGGIFTFLLQIPVTKATFPFLQQSVISSQYMGKCIIEFVCGGVMATNLISLYVFAGANARDVLKKYKIRFITISCLTLLVILSCIDATIAGLLQRYTGDFVLALLLPGCIICGCMLEYAKERNQTIYLALAKLLVVVLIATVAFDFLMLFAGLGDYNLEQTHPEVFTYARSFFIL